MGIPLMFVAFASFVCFVLVLVKTINERRCSARNSLEVVTCGIWDLHLGLDHAGKLSFRPLMLIWTTLTIVHL